MSCSRLGVLVIAFPVYVTLVASTQTSQEIVQAPMSLLPGDNMLETYRVALVGGETSYGAKVAPVGRMMWVSLVSALVITIGKIAISLLSAFAFVYFRFPGPLALLLARLRHPDAAGGGADLPDLQGRRPTSACSTPTPG